ncbi:MAG: L,D-transpeptidase family protein [Solirubrobacteraceae bacterium]
MRSKSFMAVSGFLVVLVLLGGGLYLYDSGRADQIAEGVTVGGVDIGGMDRAEATAKLESRVSARLLEPVRARYEDRKFTLTAKRARIAVDVDSTVDQALQRSRADNIFVRSFRGLTGGSIDEELDVTVSFDRKAVSDMAERVAKTLDRKAVDADVDISTAGVETVKEQTGIEVNETFLAKAISRKLASPTAKRDLRVRTSTIQPKVTTDELKDDYPSVIVVDRASFSLTLYEDLKPTLDYTVAIGAAGYDTPAGLYDIQNMAVDPVWTVPDSDWTGSLAGQQIPPGPSNPLKSRWLGIYNGAGIHGTDATYSLGTAASHGCVRMAIPDVEELYEHVDVGTPVYIG